MLTAKESAAFIKALPKLVAVGNITNGELTEIIDVIDLLRWMHDEKLSVPKTNAHLDTLLEKWLRRNRYDVWEYLLNKGKISKRVFNRVTKGLL